MSVSEFRKQIETKNTVINDLRLVIENLVEEKNYKAECQVISSWTFFLRIFYYYFSTFNLTVFLVKRGRIEVFRGNQQAIASRNRKERK